MTMDKPCEQLHNGVVLAELGGHGDGPYCAGHGAGGALVIMGTYIVDAGDKVPYPRHFVFKPGKKNYQDYLREHVAAAKDSRARVAVSVVCVELKDTLEFLQAAEEAGADYAAYCAYSTMKMFVSRGLGRALCGRGQRDNLKRCATEIVKAVSIPVIFKMGAEATPAETVEIVETLAASGVPVVSIAVEGNMPGSAGLKTLSALRGTCSCLIGGGGISDETGARRMLESGADAVAIAAAAMNDPHLIGRIQKALR